MKMCLIGSLALYRELDAENSIIGKAFAFGSTFNACVSLASDEQTNKPCVNQIFSEGLGPNLKFSVSMRTIK